MISDPTTIRTAFVSALKAVPVLVALLGGDSANIVEYAEEANGDLSSTISNGIKKNQILVFIDSIQPRNFPALIRVGVSIAVKSGSAFQIYSAICNGPFTGGLRLIEATLLNNFLPMEIPSLDRTGIIIGDQSTLDYFVIRTGFTDKGY